MDEHIEFSQLFTPPPYHIVSMQIITKEQQSSNTLERKGDSW